MSEHSPYLIRVRVEPAYILEQSDPDRGRFVFSYTVTIENHGTVAAQLRTRHWVITDGEGKIQEVRGDGVVGEQPYLQPGEGFRYTSGTVMETPVGTMEGSYQMVASDGHEFEAEIPRFTLTAPRTLH